MGRNTGHGCDPRAELLRPEDRTAAQAAPHVEDIPAERGRRAPDLGRMAQQAFLRGDYPLAEFQRGCIQWFRLIDKACVIVHTRSRSIPLQDGLRLALVVGYEFLSGHTRGHKASLRTGSIVLNTALRQRSFSSRSISAAATAQATTSRLSASGRVV